MPGRRSARCAAGTAPPRGAWTAEGAAAQGRRNARAPLFLVVTALVSIGRTRAQLGANVQRFPPFRRFTPPPKDAALAKLCDACAGAPGALCRDIDEQCWKSLCITMCLEKTWDCEIEITGVGLRA